MERVLRFAASPKGRWTRMSVGTVLIGIAVARRGRAGRLIVPGLAALLSGVLDLVPIAPLFDLPMHGAELRERLGMATEAPLIMSYSDRMSAKRARQGAPVD